MGLFTGPYTVVERYVADDSNKGGSDKRKQSLYFPEAMLQEIKDEAARLDRSLSWVVQRAWKLARLEIKKIPSVNDIGDDDDDSDAS
ncbi:MAG TPA: TIGR04563 family protein [Polyangiaceae bacterium]|nr:TIGR04563 family protein [Polyangiaceae bacterium]HMR75758.1 TIGR04563 family protein [Polyangiaceae bacterium]